MANGGRAVLRRILDAYGFTLQKELGDLLGISSGTISTWVRRDFSPVTWLSLAPLILAYR